MAINTLEICAGVGMLGEGLRAGLARMGIDTRVCCYLEREAYPAAVLAARMQDGALDAAPVWSDILAKFPWLAPAIDKTAESVLHGMADGMASGMEFSNRAARLKCCGNGVVPLQAAAATVVLIRRMMEAA